MDKAIWFRNKRNHLREIEPLEWLVLSIPLILSVVIMLPRIISPQFGLLDDGITLQSARKIGIGDWDIWDFSTGRSRPVHWIYLFLVNLVSQSAPRGYFIVNSLVLALLVILVMLLMFRLVGSVGSAALAGLLFVISSPIVESFYTIAKGEPLQLLFLLISLIAAIHISSEHGGLNRGLRVAPVAILLFAAMASKETALVILPISLLWLLLALMLTGKSNYRNIDLLDFSIACLLGTSMFFIMRGFIAGTGLIDQGYADQYQFTAARLLSTGTRWLIWLVHDFLYLLPLGFFIILQYKHRKTIPHAGVLLGAGIWAVFWVAIYLYWVFVADYYLLPTAAGVAIIASIAFSELLTATPPSSGLRRVTLSSLLLGLLFILITLPNNFTFARQQLAVDIANEAMIEFVALNAPESIAVSPQLQGEKEYAEELSLHLSERFDRADVQVLPEPLDAGGIDRINSQTWIVVPVINNQVLLSPRLGLYELKVEPWRAQMLPKIVNAGEKIFQHTEGFRITKVNTPSLFCPVRQLITTKTDSAAEDLLDSINRYCNRSPFIDLRSFTYGWEIYRIGAE